MGNFKTQQCNYCYGICSDGDNSPGWGSRLSRQSLKTGCVEASLTMFPEPDPSLPFLPAAAECFLGVIKPLTDESTVATAYCTSSGLSVNSKEPLASCSPLSTCTLAECCRRIAYLCVPGFLPTTWLLRETTATLQARRSPCRPT